MTAAGTPEGDGLLPDPAPRPRHHTVISVDDHLVEPRNMFEGRLASRFAASMPRVVETPEGNEEWEYDGKRFAQLGLNAVVGRRNRERWTFEPTRYEQMREGCYDIHARVRDMDINGVWASVNFPSQLSGFCGAIFSSSSDQALGQAVMKAWNDWLFEEWYGSYPQRIVPMGITWLADPVLGAREIERNAGRGFTAVTLPERPHALGYPSLHSGWWDPLIAACEATGTVICLHVGSSGGLPVAEDAPQLELGATLFPALSLHACADWLWSGVPVRFPDVRIAMSEGGIGWVPMLIDRLDHMMTVSGHGRIGWMSDEMTPSEVLRRNFWFCTIDDPSTLGSLGCIGEDKVMVEVDYPHADSTWPDTQQFLEERLRDIPQETAAKITHLNAARLFRHPLPPSPAGALPG